jgi:hypothetical protein
MFQVYCAKAIYRCTADVCQHVHVPLYVLSQHAPERDRSLTAEVGQVACFRYVIKRLRFYWIFSSILFKKRAESSGRYFHRGKRRFEGDRDKSMISKKIIGFMAAATLLFVLAAPGAPAGRTIELTIPGCAS